MAKSPEVKLAVFGRAGVGKSALVVRFLTRRFIWEYDPTLDTLTGAAVAQNKRKALNETNEKKLLDKIQLLEAKVEELKLEEEQHQEQLSLIRQRLKDLERTQQLQLEELGSVVQRDQDPTP